jgi:hypothetical protein
MDKVANFFQLKELWKKSDEAGRADIDKELSVLMDSMTPEEMNALVDGVERDFARMHEELKVRFYEDEQDEDEKDEDEDLNSSLNLNLN